MAQGINPKFWGINPTHEVVWEVIAVYCHVEKALGTEPHSKMGLLCLPPPPTQAPMSLKFLWKTRMQTCWHWWHALHSKNCEPHFPFSFFSLLHPLAFTSPDHGKFSPQGFYTTQSGAQCRSAPHPLLFFNFSQKTMSTSFNGWFYQKYIDHLPFFGFICKLPPTVTCGRVCKIPIRDMCLYLYMFT